MKILLGSLFFPREEGPGEHLGLAYLAAWLRENGHEVHILDTLLEDLSLEQTLTTITSQPYDLLGISTFERGIKPLEQLIKQLRMSGLTTPIILGGHFASFRFGELLTAWQGIDAVCLGEGELPLNQLARHLKYRKSWPAIPGLACRTENGISYHPPASAPILEALPFPARDTLPAVLRLGGRASLSSSRGCYGGCTFCSIAAFYRLAPGASWRSRCARHVVTEISRVQQSWTPPAFEFVDDNFIGPGPAGAARARAIGEALKQAGLNIRFSIACRADNVEPQLFRFLHRAGLDEVFLGLESGAPATLQLYNKHCTVECGTRALDILHYLGIRARLGFIMFDPYTTLERLTQNLAFLQADRRYRWLASPELLRSRLIPFRGTPIATRLQREGRLKHRGFHEIYPFIDPQITQVYQSMEQWMQLGQCFETGLRDLKWQARSRGIYHDPMLNGRFQALETDYSERLLDFLSQTAARVQRAPLTVSDFAHQTGEITSALSPLLIELQEIQTMLQARFQALQTLERSPA